MKNKPKSKIRLFIYLLENMLGYIYIKMNSFIYIRHFKRILKLQGYNPHEKIEGEEAYVKKWNALSLPVERYSYRLYSHYCGKNPDIVPEVIGRSIIEPILNPVRFRAFYSDKNLYRKYLPDSFLPRTIACRIGGGNILDQAYQPIQNEVFANVPKDMNELILKPSIDSNSGVGVMKLIRHGSDWYTNNEDLFTEKDLMGFGDDFILQEAIKQHPFMSHFCATSVNTLRIATYRSVKDEQVHVISSCMRIGKLGSFVDNAHAGGMVIGINIDTGKLQNYATDQYGCRYSNWNDINFIQSEYFVPNWENILNFARKVAIRNLHLRFLALDICIDKEGMPKLIEFNCVAFSYWLMMFNGYTPFGNYTDEIIDYCSKHKAEQMKIEC